MDQFENEVHLLKVIFEGVVVSCFDEILTNLKSLSQHEISLLDYTATIVEMILINPSTTATVERSFSGHRRLTPRLRTSTKSKRSNSLATFHFHKRETEALNLIDVANDFVELNDNRKAQVGVFTVNDFKC